MVTITVGDIKPGKYFLLNNEIWLRIHDEGKPQGHNAVRTSDGYHCCLYPPMANVIPVDVIIRAQLTSRINHDS